jgi:hypothetical protein
MNNNSVETSDYEYYENYGQFCVLDPDADGLVSSYMHNFEKKHKYSDEDFDTYIDDREQIYRISENALIRIRQMFGQFVGTVVLMTIYVGGAAYYIYTAYW